VVVILQNFFLSAPYGRNWNCELILPHLLWPPTRLSASILIQSSPLDHAARHGMANTTPLCGILRFHMDCSSLHVGQTVQIPQLDPSSYRLWLGCSALGSDMVGNIWLGLVPSLGWKLYSRSSRFPLLVALAWGSRCTARSRIRYDPSTDLNSDAYMLHPLGLPSAGLSSNDLCQSLRSE
jgi:hypothetical protein